MTKIIPLSLAFFVLLFSVFIVKAETLFTKDLYFDIQDDSEVIKLQEFLTNRGFYSGPITGNFFSLTLEAVKKFQQNYGITPVAGYFGAKTRGKANEIISSQAGAGSTVNLLQAQIEALLQQVSLLQQQLQALQQNPIVPTDMTPPVISGIKISLLGSTSVAVSWNTDELAQSTLYYDTDVNFPAAKSINIEGFQMNHGYVIGELNLSTKYYCKIMAVDKNGNAASSSPFSFTVN